MSDQLHYVRGGRKLDPAVRVEMIECGSCESYHREDFLGDCRTDSQRFIHHDLSYGDPEYVCSLGEQWITDLELSNRILAEGESGTPDSLSSTEQGAPA